jgi:hypothetical protein
VLALWVESYRYGDELSNTISERFYMIHSRKGRLGFSGPAPIPAGATTAVSAGHVTSSPITLAHTSIPSSSP